MLVLDARGDVFRLKMGNEQMRLHRIHIDQRTHSAICGNPSYGLFSSTPGSMSRTTPSGHEVFHGLSESGLGAA